MAMFVIITPFIGQCLVFLIFPVLMLPYFEDKFEVRLPQVLPPMDGRVLFYHYGPAIESLVVEFENANSPFVILEEDMNQARSLRDRGSTWCWATWPQIPPCWRPQRRRAV
jgi:hypothetical protein